MLMEIKIFWCRFNKYYAQKWLDKLWYKENAILIASCAVTDNAKKKFIKEVKQHIKKGKKVYLTWCWAFSKNWKVDEDFFYNAYPSLKDYQEYIVLLEEDPKHKTSNIENKIYTKHFSLVQLWCNSHCTFCITVKKRWEHRNRKVEEVIKEIQKVEKKWIKEVVITWINLAAWWMKDTNTWPNPYFPKYLQAILDNTNIPRIRISSIWPEFIDESWYKVLENKRILPFFHLSIQSWSDKILKSMWRHYDSKHIKKVITNLRNLNKSLPVNIGADIIVWFPWETEKDFQKTLELARDYNISKLHVFPFSSHQIWDTVPAWSFKNQIDLQTKKEREKQLIKICDKNYEKLTEQTKGKTVKILVEENNSWWTENYLKYESKRRLKTWEIFETIY